MHRLPVAVSQKAFEHLRALPGWELVPLETLGERDAAAFVLCLGEEKRWGRRLGEAPLVLCEAHTLDLEEAVRRAAAAPAAFHENAGGPCGPAASVFRYAGPSQRTVFPAHRRRPALRFARGRGHVPHGPVRLGRYRGRSLVP